jgi:hypothetical protein
MPDPLLYLQATLATAIVSAVVVLAMAGSWRQGSPVWLNGVSVWAVFIGLIVGYGMLGFRAVWPPVTGLNRLLLIVVPITVGLEWISGCIERPVWIIPIVRTGLALAIPRILLHDSVYLNGTDHPWSTGMVTTTLCFSGLLLAGVGAMIRSLSKRSGGVAIPMALGLTTLCAGLVLMMSGYLKGGTAALPLAATVISTSVSGAMITKWMKGPEASCSAAAIGIVGLFGLLFIGRFFGRLSSVCAIILLLVPLLCWVTELPQLRHRNPRLLVIVLLLLVAFPLSTVLVLAKRDFDRNMGLLL